ncbi:MAG: aldo/keto reductase [Victivallaceae bacterium]|nr:aldo/keto reductase [Victivallaceae bacterium]
MKLRKFGQRNGHQVPRLSIGAMRFPKDVDCAVALLRDAIDKGLRYIDTSRGYGESEWILGLALKHGYRDKVILSTKWSPWITKIAESDNSSSDCVRRRIEESMKRLDVDYLDYYQVWNIQSRECYDKAIAKGGMVDGILKAKEEGLIGHIGFTTHDSVENLLIYIKEADWCEILLTTYNMLNTTYAPVIEAAHAKGIGTVIMNPVAGGKLAEQSPVLMELANKVGAVSVADLAIRYVLSNPNIDTMLNGLNKTEDTTHSIASVERGAFLPAQIEIINRYLEKIKGQVSAFCTNCKYCIPCPVGIDIPGVMSCIQDARYWGWEESARTRYGNIKGDKADACVQCGKCEKICTQNLKIINEMAHAVEMFKEI